MILERDSWSTERIRLDATIRDKERIIASMTADYHRDAGNRQLVLGRCYELTAQGRQLSDAVAMGNTAHQLLKHQLADKDNGILARSGAKRRHSPDSDADSSGSALVSGHASSRSSPPSRSRKKARATPTTSPVSSKKSSSRRSTNKKAAKSPAAVSYSPSEDSDDEDGPAPLRRPRRTAAANCSAIQRLLHAGESDSDSEVLGEAAAVSSSSGCDRQASSGSSAVSSTSAPPPSSPVTSSSPTQAPPGSIADLASANASVSSYALAEDPEGADSSGVESSSTSRQTEAASTLASLSGATKSVVIRALPPGKHPAWSPSDSDSDGGDSTAGGSAATAPNLSNKLVESSDSSGDESTLAGSSKPKSQASSAAGSGSPPLASPTMAVRPSQVTTSTPVSATAKAPVSSTTPPPARSPVRSSTSTSKSRSASKATAVVPARSANDASKPKAASKAKSTAAIRSAKDESKPKSASKPSAAASARLDSCVSGVMKRLRQLPFFHKGSKRCWEKIMSSCAVSVTMEKIADGERIKPTPCSIADLATFMDVDDSGHTWRSVLRLLPHSLFFVDDSVLEVCPPVEKGKRSKKPGSLLGVLSHELCKSHGVVREDILLVLWKRMHWIVESSVNVWLAEAFLASERTSRIDFEFTALWKSPKDYLLGRKQQSDLLRLTVKMLGDAVVGAANHKIHGLPAPLVDTEVCFDPAIPFCPPVNLPWFPRTADWIAETVRIDNHEPWRL
ncbi:unnamed protein product [Phytophthora fragariaefolia]|uniref:Unnamed protein product n=1 Tax=Phytophthora fragariaefolia TaxID=1490495 RepID=A0A9W6Y0X1_9STRA|nr:unnamed protein product [Phytophthora fragariaefolia]